MSINYIILYQRKQIMSKMYKIEYYVPESHLEITKKAIFETGAGQIGNYDSCCWQTLGNGQFRPLKGSTPYIGQSNKLEIISEYKVELVCKDKFLQTAIQSLRKSHPYETPAYCYWQINN